MDMFIGYEEEGPVNPHHPHLLGILILLEGLERHLLHRGGPRNGSQSNRLVGNQYLRRRKKVIPTFHVR